jgi:hypothetical protein
VTEYEFEVAEAFRTVHFYTVNASTREEALDKVLNGDHEKENIYCVRGDLFPIRPLTVRDVKRGRPVKKADSDS